MTLSYEPVDSGDIYRMIAKQHNCHVVFVKLINRSHVGDVADALGVSEYTLLANEFIMYKTQHDEEVKDLFNDLCENVGSEYGVAVQHYDKGMFVGGLV